MPIKLKSCFYYVFKAPSQPPGNIVWNVTDSRVILNWEEVRAMENESEVTGYKVSKKTTTRVSESNPYFFILSVWKAVSLKDAYFSTVSFF